MLAVPRWRVRYRRAVGQVDRQDDTFPDEPADKLYNEGLFLMNRRRIQVGVEEVRGSRPPASLFRLGAQIAADDGLCHYETGDYDDCIGAATRYVTLHPGSPDAAYAQYLIGCRISTRSRTSRAIRAAPSGRLPRLTR